MTAVCELVSGLDAELVRLGYKPSTLKWYRGCWRRLERYFASRGAREFSLDIAMAWVDVACGGFFEKEQAGMLKQTDVYLFRVAAMLDDFAVHGSVLRRYSRSVSKLSVDQADVVAGFGAWLRAEGCAVSTVRAYGTVAGEFLAFTANRGGLAALDGAVIGAAEAIKEARSELRCAQFVRASEISAPPETPQTPVDTAMGDTGLEPVTSALSRRRSPS